MATKQDSAARNAAGPRFTGVDAAQKDILQDIFLRRLLASLGELQEACRTLAAAKPDSGKEAAETALRICQRLSDRVKLRRVLLAVGQGSILSGGRQAPSAEALQNLGDADSSRDSSQGSGEEAEKRRAGEQSSAGPQTKHRPEAPKGKDRSSRADEETAEPEDGAQPEEDSGSMSEAGDSRPKGAKPLNGRVVLLVEDVRSVRKVTARILVMAGATVLEAQGGKEALRILELLKTRDPIPSNARDEIGCGPAVVKLRKEKRALDLMVLDLMMPDLSGQEVLYAIRKDRDYNKLPVLIQSADSEKDNVLRCIRLGIQGYIVKPAEPETLIEGVRQALNRSAGEKIASLDSSEKQQAA
ncbi:MAG: response regulator [Candidatus Eisenbacteria bacterium]|nr:response regulator [Candidatus Eisenbacteria bacterium]